MYIKQQEEQMQRVMYEQEILRKELEQQRLERMEWERRRRKEIDRTKIESRDRERNALAMLNAFERAAAGSGDHDDILSAFTSPRKKHDRYPANMPEPSFEHLRHRAPNFIPNAFQKTANMMLSPSYGSPYHVPPSGGLGGSSIDSNLVIMKLLDMIKEDHSKPKKNKLSDMMMNSLERQNQVLISLAKNMGDEKEDKTYAENKNLERKIRKLEMQTGSKRVDVEQQNTMDRLANNFNSNQSLFYWFYSLILPMLGPLPQFQPNLNPFLPKLGQSPYFFTYSWHLTHSIDPSGLVRILLWLR